MKIKIDRRLEDDKLKMLGKTISMKTVLLSLDVGQNVSDFQMCIFYSIPCASMCMHAHCIHTLHICTHTSFSFLVCSILFSFSTL